VGALATRSAEIVAQLDAAGIRATDDPRAVLPPCALVGPPTLQPSNIGGCAYDATWRIDLIGVASGGIQAFQSLDDLLENVLPLLPGYEIATPGTWLLSGGGDPLPSYTVNWMEAVPWP